MAQVESNSKTLDVELQGESSDTFEDAQEANNEASELAKSQDTIRNNSTAESTNGNIPPAADQRDLTAPTLPPRNGQNSDSDARQPSSDRLPHLSRSGLPERSMSPTRRLQRPISIVRERSGSPNKSKRLSIGLPIRPSSSLSDVSNAQADRALDSPVEVPSSPTKAPELPPRKSSSTFAGLFGRMSSIRRPARSPPSSKSDKRSTMASTSSADSNGLSPIVDEGVSRASKRSLQDRFKEIREQGEHNNVGDADDQKTPVARKWSDASAASATSSVVSGDSSRSRASSTVKSPTLNPNLPPGTAAGVSVGPSTETDPVDWDLWQAVVCEGPTAVARSSGEELNHAIASGIPAAIRGVVWQVLAESKNEDLENIYRTLKARGSDSESSATPTPSLSRSQSQPTGPNDTPSRSSSTHGGSGPSTPPADLASPATEDPTTNGISSELRAKLLVEKQKRESVAISKLEKVIKRDMGTRTSFSKYVQSAGLQDGLFGICKAYALFDEGVGYAQGINFITMPLLFNMSEEEAFTLLVRLMSKYEVRSLFTAEMPGLHLRLYQFERLLEDFEPALGCHLKRRNVSPQLYATQWFLTLFAYRFPLQLVLRIYDLIFSEGLTAIFQFGIVLMQKNRQALLEMKDMGQLTTFLKEKLFDVYIDKTPSASSILDSGFFGAVTGGIDKEVYRADDLVRDACSIKISEITLASYATEWEESQRVERERVEELEKLRTHNISLVTRVKALEEQVQQQDVEHVAIAGDLVRTKVENENLHDENEGLKLKVTELQRMVDLQPGEVEDRLKSEMDRIMQRNIEVQNENRALREEMDDVENELVKAKMSYAEIQADHDTLKQKWSSVQAMLNAGQ